MRLLENDSALAVEVGNILNRVVIMIKDSSVQPDAVFKECTKRIYTTGSGRNTKTKPYTVWSNLNCGGSCSGTCSNTYSCTGSCSGTSMPRSCGSCNGQ